MSEDPISKEQCPCCDYFTLADRGAYLICPVCFWEDDGQDIDRLDERSGPNRLTLRESRTNFKEFGVFDIPAKSHVLAKDERFQFEYHPRNLN